MESKKSIQLSQAFGAVLTLILVAVLVIVAIVIFVTLSTSFAGSATATVTNEQDGFVNATGYTIDGASACQFESPAITGIWNTSDGSVIATANFTLSSAGVLTNATVNNFAPVNLSYTYTWGSGACDASDDMVSEFGNYTSLIGLVGTIIFLGLVIGILVAAFAFGGRR